MLRWYQRLGTTGKMKVVWLACQGAPPGPARGCRDEGLVGDCMEKVGLQACPVHIQIAPPPTALSLSSYYLPSLRAYCFAPSSTLLHAPSDRFSFPQLIVLSFHHVVSQAAPLAALRAASCSQRCKQRNRADCGCQQWHLRVHQLPGGEGQEVHSRHSCQWYVAAKLCVQCTFSFSFPSTPVLLAWTAPDSSNFRSCTSRVPRLRLGRSGY